MSLFNALKFSRMGKVLVCAGMLVSSALCVSAQSNGGETVIYGFNGYAPMENQELTGLYTIQTDGTLHQLWNNPEQGMMGAAYVRISWIREGVFCCVYGTNKDYNYLECDMQTGEIKRNEQIPTDGPDSYKAMMYGAYNAADDCVYGYSFSSDFVKDYLVKAPASDMSDVTIIREMPDDFQYCVANTFNTDDGRMYGIDRWESGGKGYSSLVSVDVNGNFRLEKDVLDMGKYSIAAYNQGMIYNASDKCYYFSAQVSFQESWWAKITPSADYKVDFVRQMPEWFQFISFMTDANDGDIDAPLRAKLVSSTFSDGKLDGTLTYKMPTTLANNDPAPANMTWTCSYGNGAATQTGTAGPGEEVKVEWKNLEGGREYNFAFRCDAGDKKGASSNNIVWVGNDVPRPVGNVVLSKTDKPGEFLVSWDATTGGAHNGYLNLSDVTYVLFFNGEQQIYSTKETSAVVELDDSGEMGRSWITVYATSDNGALISEGKNSNVIYLGDGFEPPFEIIPTAEQVSMMTFINVDGDNSGWRVKEVVNDLAFFNSYDYNNRGDDWLITPKLLMNDESYYYQIAFKASVYSINMGEEFFEVWLGKGPTVDEMNVKRIQPKTQVMTQQFTDMAYKFSVDEPGSYYIGIHAISEPDMAGMFIRNISFTQTTDEVGVEEVASSAARVKAGKGIIEISGLEGGRAQVYAVSGAKMADVKVDLYRSVEVPAGVYVVVANGKSFKVVVK